MLGWDFSPNPRGNDTFLITLLLGATRALAVRTAGCMNSRGKWLIGCARNIGRCTSLQAELWALLDGLELAWSAGYTHIKVEVDCLLASHLLDQEGKHVNVYYNFIKKILYVLGRE